MYQKFYATFVYKYYATETHPNQFIIVKRVGTKTDNVRKKRYKAKEVGLFSLILVIISPNLPINYHFLTTSTREHRETGLKMKNWKQRFKYEEINSLCVHCDL